MHKKTKLNSKNLFLEMKESVSSSPLQRDPQEAELFQQLLFMDSHSKEQKPNQVL